MFLLLLLLFHSSPPLAEKVPSISAVLGMIISFSSIFSFTGIGSGTFDWVRGWVGLELCYCLMRARACVVGQSYVHTVAGQWDGLGKEGVG